MALGQLANSIIQAQKPFNLIVTGDLACAVAGPAPNNISGQTVADPRRAGPVAANVRCQSDWEAGRRFGPDLWLNPCAFRFLLALEI